MPILAPSLMHTPWCCGVCAHPGAVVCDVHFLVHIPCRGRVFDVHSLVRVTFWCRECDVHILMLWCVMYSRVSLTRWCRVGMWYTHPNTIWCVMYTCTQGTRPSWDTSEQRCVINTSWIKGVELHFVIETINNWWWLIPPHYMWII